MKKLFLTLLFLLPISAFAACDDLVAFGMPTAVEKTTELCRHAYVVQYFNQCKVPLFVSEHLLGSNVGGEEPRDTFRQDKDVQPEYRASTTDYVKTGYDKGHMAPAADFHSSKDDMYDSFLLSNALPQTKKLNRGVWKQIEIRTRALAVKHGDVYVVSGGIFDDQPATIGNGVCVPTYTFKVIMNKSLMEGVAYITENTKVIVGPIKKYEVPISMVEKMTLMNFTPALSASDAEKIKSVVGKDMVPQTN